MAALGARIRLTPRFRPILDRLIPQLPQLFTPDWPMVPNHIDLLENNIHVDPKTGRLTGICDWRDTIITPFWMSLAGLDTMLGVGIVVGNGTGWRYHPNQQTLRKLFWETFYQAIGNVSQEQKDTFEVARLVGLFLANGFQWGEDEKLIPATDPSDGLSYLDGVVLGVCST
ncbi:hypothetical protein FQN57_002890 [Myotisia sp. PD_48]|nr:hypothetical protein FQN57_002890 [Myotisia sp. PD_48]